MNDRFRHVIALIDQANSQDPNLEPDENGESHPKEWLYSQRMTRELSGFASDASEHLRIAAHGQHIERWTSPRADYPEGRSGYKKWRAELGLYHAKRVGELMEEAGYEEDDIERTKYLVQKRGIKRDAESQTLEDVICLVFIRHYLVPFAAKHEDDKLVDIIRKTWAKMSPRGHDAALSIELGPSVQPVVVRALTAD